MIKWDCTLCVHVCVRTTQPMGERDCVCMCVFDCELVLSKERSTDQTYKQPVEGKKYCCERLLNIVIKYVSTLSTKKLCSGTANL